MKKEWPPNYSEIPLSERLTMVATISETIPMDRIKFRKSGTRIDEILGFVLLDGLPFCFRAWPSFPSQRELAFLRPDEGSNMHKTNWSPHAPYNPLDFHPPIFAGEIPDDDKVYLLRRLGIKETDIEEAVAKGKDGLDGLYRTSLSGKKEEYDRFYDLYSISPHLSGAFGAAVATKCDQIEQVWKLEEAKKRASLEKQDN